MPTGKVTAILAVGTAGRGMLQPNDGGPPLTFEGADTIGDEQDGPKNLTASLIGSTVTYRVVNDLAKEVDFT